MTWYRWEPMIDAFSLFETDPKPAPTNIYEPPMGQSRRRRVADPKPEGTHRVPDHHTSIAAGLKELGRKGTQRERLAICFYRAGQNGLTDEEAASAAKIAPQSSPWKRCTELRQMGFLVYADKDRKTTTGTDAKVWRMTGAGMRALRERLRD